jgi:hypothetical protein
MDLLYKSTVVVLPKAFNSEEEEDMAAAKMAANNKPTTPVG